MFLLQLTFGRAVIYWIQFELKIEVSKLHVCNIFDTVSSSELISWFEGCRWMWFYQIILGSVGDI